MQIQNDVKTEIILFKSRYEPCDEELEFKLRKNIVYRTNYVRHIGTKIDQTFNWKSHIHGLISKF